MLIDEHDVRRPNALPLRPRIVGATIDGSRAFAAALDQVLDDAVIHRCLQHVKCDIDREARHKVTVGGTRQRRLQDLELLPDLLDRVMTTSKFSRQAEFSAAWTEIHDRYTDESDLNEPTPLSLLIGFIISDIHDPFPSQILGTFSMFSDDFPGRERGIALGNPPQTLGYTRCSLSLSLCKKVLRGHR